MCLANLLGTASPREKKSVAEKLFCPKKVADEEFLHRTGF
jgi:hypothetical protein